MKDLINATLVTLIQTMPASKLKDAVRYALTTGGKRFRPLLILTILESYGVDPKPFVDIACSLELIHAYSLIHDDLPAMDDDTIRHGQPTVHIKFDEATAILAGDGLLTHAFSVVAHNPNINAEQKVKIVQILADNAGLEGMVYGQHLDLEGEKKKLTFDELKTLSLHKTGKLLRAACEMGAVLAEVDSVVRWGEIGENLGIMFQIQDDILEVTTSETQRGKSASDVLLEKATFVSQLGLEHAKKLVDQYYKTIQSSLKKTGFKSDRVTTLIETIYRRKV